MNTEYRMLKYTFIRISDAFTFIIRYSIFVICFLIPLSVSSQPCTFADPKTCKCKDTVSTNCDLLPDLVMSAKALTDSGAYEEYPSVNAGENYATQGADDGRFRLTIATPNIGMGPLHLVNAAVFICGNDTFTSYPGKCPDGYEPEYLVNQRIFQKTGDSLTFYERPAGSSSYHPVHKHVHVSDWAVYSLRLKIPWEPDPKKWPVVGERNKTGFCLYDFASCSMRPGQCKDNNDSTLLDTNFPNFDMGNYPYCSDSLQGISSGHMDSYEKWLYGMWVDIEPGTCNGEYYIVAEVDPLNNYLEENETNNVSVGKVTLTKQDPPGNPKIKITGNKPLSVCGNDSVLLTATAGFSYLWSTGDTVQSIYVKQAGSYSVAVTNHCGTGMSQPVTVSLLPSPSLPLTLGDSICKNDSAVLSVTNPSDSVFWYSTPSGGNRVGTGNNFVTPVLSGSKTYYAENNKVYPPLAFTAAKPDSGGGSGGYVPGGSFLLFDAYSDFILEAVTVYAADSGFNTIELRDKYGNAIEGKPVSFTKGKNRIVLNMIIPAGDNLQLFLSGKDDSLFSDTTIAVYPYEIPGVVSIKNSSRSKAHYFYFYKWEIKTNPVLCSSTRVPVIAFVDSACTAGINDPVENNPLKIFPNPFSDFATVEISGGMKPVKFVLYDVLGTALLEIVNSSGTFRLQKQSLKAGIYFYRLFSGEVPSSVGKIIVQ